MEILIIILPLSLALTILFVIAYLWAVKSGQFSDNHTPAIRILFDDEEEQKKEKL